MDRYQRVEKPRPEAAISENEIRITSQGLIRNYITYALTLLHEKKAKEIVLKAMGQAISKSVAITEILKKQIPNMYQDTSISSVSITDVWEPIEEGLVPLETTRQVSMVSITLSLKELDKTSPGYQAPLVAEPNKSNQYQQLPQQQQPYNRQYNQPRQYQSRQAHGEVAERNEESYGRGRGGGRARGRGRGWGRGGYYNDYQENGHNYNNYSGWNRGGGGGGRGRGYGYRGGYDRSGGGNRYERNNGYDQQNGGYEWNGPGYERGNRGYERNAGYERNEGYDRRGGGYDRYERGRGGGGGGGGSRGFGGGRGRMSGGRGRRGGPGNYAAANNNA